MFCLMLIGIFAGFVAVTQAQGFPQATVEYANQKVLRDDRIRLLWNYTKTSFTGELQAKTNGWVAFGLSPNGGMDGSDVFVAWIDSNGNTNFTDRYIVGREVKIDKQQDWRLLSCFRTNGFLVVKFQRDINTCDPNDQDREIEVGTPKVIYSWSDDTPALNQDISYHGSNRGIGTVPLLSALNDPLKITAEDAIETYDFNVNTSVPAWETYYHCHMFKLPDNLLNNKRHLIRTITKLTAGNEDYVHHWLMYQCDSTFETEYLASGKSLPLPGHCFDYEYTNSANPKNTWLKVLEYCRQVTLVWAIGGELTIDFPNGLGFPVGGSDAEFKYFFLEMHYNNPQLKSDIFDKSGIQLNVTPKFRPTEIGVFTNGAASSWSGIIIPPQQQSHKMRYFCRNNCLNGLTQNGDITIFATAPHTHTVGTAVVSTVVRGGKEVQYITNSENYDFNYQFINFIQTPIKLKMNDEIQTTCTYKTIGRNTYTFGGIGTPQEMW